MRYLPLQPHAARCTLTGGKQAQDAAVTKCAHSRLDPEAPRFVLPIEPFDILHCGCSEEQRDGCAVLVEVMPPVPQEGEVLHLTSLQRCTARNQATCQESSSPLAEYGGASLASCAGQEDKRWLRGCAADRKPHSRLGGAQLACLTLAGMLDSRHERHPLLAHVADVAMAEEGSGESWYTCNYMHVKSSPMPSGASSGSRGVPKVAIASLAVCWSANTMLPAAV